MWRVSVGTFSWSEPIANILDRAMTAQWQQNQNQWATAYCAAIAASSESEQFKPHQFLPHLGLREALDLEYPLPRDACMDLLSNKHRLNAEFTLKMDKVIKAAAYLLSLEL
jgi:hypothetical protein